MRGSVVDKIYREWSLGVELAEKSEIRGSPEGDIAIEYSPGPQIKS